MADSSELACAYASLILHDDGHKVTADKLLSILKASGVEVESYWPSIFESALERSDLGELISNIGSGAASAPAQAQVGGSSESVQEKVEEKKEEPVEEEDDGMGISLFGDDDY